MESMLQDVEIFSSDLAKSDNLIFLIYKGIDARLAILLEGDRRYKIFFLFFIFIFGQEM
jgi:hypothetical protein